LDENSEGSAALRVFIRGFRGLPHVKYEGEAGRGKNSSRREALEDVEKRLRETGVSLKKGRGSSCLSGRTREGRKKG